MEKRLSIISAVLCACFLWVPNPAWAASQSQALILIDPAHGGDEPGVVSEKVREKDVTLQLALLIQQEAQKVPGLQVQLLRQTDRSLDTGARIKAVQDKKPDCLVSLHANAGFGRKAQGYEIYFPGFRQDVARGREASAIVKDMTANRHLNDSVRLAQQIESALEAVFPRKGRGLRDAPNPLLEGVNVPGLLVELGFVTQPDERAKLTEPSTQKAIARAIVKGLKGYLQKSP